MAAAPQGSTNVKNNGRHRDKFPLGVPPVQPDMPFNPFVNGSAPLSDPWEYGKCILMLPIFLIRVCLFVLAFTVGFIVAHVTLIAARDIYTRPFPRWRQNMLWPVSACVRMVLFALGFNWIRVKGKPAKRDVAPILVSNHMTAVDPLYIFMAHLPMIVTAKENLNIPVAGVVMKALQVVTVDRANPASRKEAGGEIKRRAMCNDWKHVALFPEATTTNGRSLVSFKTGAFLPGLPVQPMLVRYPHTTFDPSWVADGMDTPLLIFRMMCQLHNQMTVEYLPPVFPTEKEIRDPRLFAERCRMIMAKALNVNVTEHSFGDVYMALEAQKLKLPKGTTNLEFGRMERLYKLDIPEAKGYLRTFSKLTVDKSGTVTYSDFLESLDIPDSEASLIAFDLFDTDEDRKIDFREFVLGLLFVTRHPDFASSVASIFKLLDVDADGAISAEDARSGFSSLNPLLSSSQVANMLKVYGLDAKAQLTAAEFSDIIKAHPEQLVLALAALAAKSKKEN